MFFFTKKIVFFSQKTVFFSQFFFLPKKLFFFSNIGFFTKKFFFSQNIVFFLGSCHFKYFEMRVELKYSEQRATKRRSKGSQLFKFFKLQLRINLYVHAYVYIHTYNPIFIFTNILFYFNLLFLSFYHVYVLKHFIRSDPFMFFFVFLSIHLIMFRVWAKVLNINCIPKSKKGQQQQ